MTGQTPDDPLPLREVSSKLAGWIGQLGAIWTEGEIVSPKISGGFCYFTLRDLEAQVVINAMASRTVWEGLAAPVTDGSRVVVHGRIDWYGPRGSLSLKVDALKPVGEGELLAQLERRKQLLAAEGLFDPRHKLPLPFLPSGVGLITGKDSDAERDVLENARRRWPGVNFIVRHARVQGDHSARDVITALAALDADPQVDVIVIARGGGSMQDLLSFSDEGLVRAVFAATTPVVSAIGHEPDTPILDFVADVRASTPTDAAKRVVPDVVAELDLVDVARDRSRAALERFLARELEQLTAVRSRPSMAQPLTLVDEFSAQTAQLIARCRTTLDHRLHRASDDVDHHLARVRALSPLATLQRGYAVLETPDGHVVSSVADAPEQFSVRLADGHVDATRTGIRQETP